MNEKSENSQGGGGGCPVFLGVAHPFVLLVARLVKD